MALLCRPPPAIFGPPHNLTSDLASAAGGKIIISGSRLGVNTEGDAETVATCIVPKFVCEEDFFGSGGGWELIAAGSRASMQ